MQIILIVASSLDGFITHHNRSGSAFTSAEDKAYFRAVLAGFPASIMGGTTYRAEREMFMAKRTAERHRIVMTRNPEAFASDARHGELEFTSEPPSALVARLKELGVPRVALLGGSQIHSLFLDAGLVDELWLTLEPRLFGAGTPLLAGKADHRLKLIGQDHLGGDTLLVKYKVLR